MPKQKRIVITDKFLLAHQKPLSRLEEVWDSRAQPNRHLLLQKHVDRLNNNSGVEFREMKKAIGIIF